MGAVLVNGVVLHVEAHGTGVPILGIHGTGSSASLWARAVPELAARGRVILYDRRGCGRSERRATGSSGVRSHADDAAALVDALDASPAVVIGRSYGGEVAVDLALRYPALVRCLVLLEPSMPMLSPESRDWLERLRRRLPPGTAPADAAARLIEAAFGEGTWEQLPDEMRTLFVDNGDAILTEVHGAWTQPSAPELAQLDVPTLLLSGDDSP
ncbi:MULTISPECIES: alpha/beta fold hydrolase, partial [unclassified Nocardioides]|uniref:alpha/beta fold hydrolase n=1 Tax=unclassified Nocardioides TaxID=2615069 RepID=UPI00360FC557